MDSFDICIIGSGIVGLSTAYKIIKNNPNKRVLILEKESGPAKHQTGNNSGVLHSGIYYRPGSLRAINCRKGKLAMEKFCKEESIPHEICGKVIVAVTPDEIPRLLKIQERGQANGVNSEVIGKSRLKELEPHVHGVKAIHVPEAGIVDYKQVCIRLMERVCELNGNQICFNAKVRSIVPEGTKLRIFSSRGEYHANHVVNCAGLHSDRVTKAGGQRPDVKIIPFRGEYFELKPNAHHLCKSLIYPVPDPNYPFLGVHFTRMINGSVECGPNAVFAFAREGYGKLNTNLRDITESLTYSGFIRLTAKCWKVGAAEMWRSLSKKAFVKALQRLAPEIESKHLLTAPSGVRAQAVSPDGNMVDDFLIQQNKNITNVCNAPSPAATSSLNIGSIIAEKCLSH